METTDKPVWLKYMPEYVNIYYVDYNDNLNDHLNILQSCVSKNSLYPLFEVEYDFWVFPEEGYLDEIKCKMANDDLEDEYDECLDEIRDWLYDHDESTPSEDLLKNTSDFQCFYDLDNEIKGYTEPQFLCESVRLTEEEDDVKNICCFLKINDESRIKQIRSLVANATYGGNLRIYFDSDVKTLISGEECPNGENVDWKSVHFKGEFRVAIINSGNGSGDFEDIELNVTLPFNRENLFISELEKWGMEEIFGCNKAECSAPSFLFTEVVGQEIAVSSTAAQMKKDRQYTKTYEAGGCTRGDVDMRRHRNVTYINEIPCGSKCPHCGQFWVD